MNRRQRSSSSLRSAAAFLEDKTVVEGQQVDIATDAARLHMRRTVERLLEEEARMELAAEPAGAAVNLFGKRISPARMFILGPAKPGPVDWRTGAGGRRCTDQLG